MSFGDMRWYVLGKNDFKGDNIEFIIRLFKDELVIVMMWWGFVDNINEIL